MHGFSVRFTKKMFLKLGNSFCRFIVRNSCNLLVDGLHSYDNCFKAAIWPYFMNNPILPSVFLVIHASKQLFSYVKLAICYLFICFP
jgi:hypothetical protein